MKSEDRNILLAGVFIGGAVLLDDALSTRGLTWSDFLHAMLKTSKKPVPAPQHALALPSVPDDSVTLEKCLKCGTYNARGSGCKCPVGKTRRAKRHVRQKGKS